MGVWNKKIYQSTITQFSGRRIGFPACAGPPCGLAALPDLSRDFAALNLVIDTSNTPAFLRHYRRVMSLFAQIMDCG